MTASFIALAQADAGPLIYWLLAGVVIVGFIGWIASLLAREDEEE